MEKPEATFGHSARSWKQLLAEVSSRAPPAFTAATSADDLASSVPCPARVEGAATPPFRAPLDELLILIVPYRSRARHLRLMLSDITGYLDALLQRQEKGEQQQPSQGHQYQQQEGGPAGRTGYCIIVAEQKDSRPFHRSLLLNAACLWAAKQRSESDSCASLRLGSNATRTPQANGEGFLEPPSEGSESDVLPGPAISPTATSCEVSPGEERGLLGEVQKMIKEAQRVFVCLHDVDVVPKGHAFDVKCREGQPCAYLPAPCEGIVRHLYGEPWSLSMVVCMLLEDFSRADGHDLRYEGWGFEDEDFCRRCQQAGLFIQRGPLVSLEAGEGIGVGAPSSDGSLTTRAHCDSPCCTRIFSRRMCACAPFRELDVFSTDMLRTAMLSKLRSPEGQGNRRLFCSLWRPTGEACAESCQNAAAQQACAEEAKSSQESASDYGLRKTELLARSGRLKLHVEPWPSTPENTDEIGDEHQTQQAGVAYSPYSLIAGTLAVEARTEVASASGSERHELASSEFSRDVACRASDTRVHAGTRETKPTIGEDAVPKNTDVQGLMHGYLREQMEADALRRELLATYGSRLVWLNVSLSPDAGGEGLLLEAVGRYKRDWKETGSSGVTQKRPRPKAGGMVEKTSNQP